MATRTREKAERRRAEELRLRRGRATFPVPRQPWWTAAVGSMIIGLFFIGAAGVTGWNALQMHRIETDGARVEAEVLGTSPGRRGGGRVIQYRFLAGGRWYGSRGAGVRADGWTAGYFIDDRRRGERVAVRYWREDPEANELASAGSPGRVAGQLGLSAVFGAMSLIGWVPVVWAFTRRRRGG